MEGLQQALDTLQALLLLSFLSFKFIKKKLWEKPFIVVEIINLFKKKYI